VSFHAEPFFYGTTHKVVVGAGSGGSAREYRSIFSPTLAMMAEPCSPKLMFTADSSTLRLSCPKRLEREQAAGIEKRKGPQPKGSGTGRTEFWKGGKRENRAGSLGPGAEEGR
jgi:hypothetical protein